MEDTPPRQPSPDEIESLETLDRIDAPTLDRGAARGRAPTTPELSSGQTVGSYRLRRELGRGGFGQVWEAEDVSSGRRVAVKILTTPHASEIDRQRFEREGRLAASVSHPNCVFVFTAEEIGGLPTIVMELVPGGTLQDLMRSSGPLPAARAVDYALDVLDGLDAAHRGGVIHRDVKPSNCFLDAEGRVKIGDFGLSRTQDVDTHLTATGIYAGTPAYSSPEQVRAQELDFRSDLYSLGGTLYSLLTGRAPFEGTQLGAVLSRILTEAPPSLASHGVGVPAGLERALLRMMAKDPTRRFPSYASARAALLPYSSRGSGPASVARRVVAALVDAVVLMPIMLGAMAARSDPLAVPFVGSMVGLAYYVVLEKRWAKSLGKRALGLEVASVAGGYTTWRQILLRTAVYSSVPLILVLSSWLLGQDTLVWRSEPTGPDEARYTAAVDVPALGALLWFGLLASTMRRRNGYAGLHELASGTRVRSVGERERSEGPEAVRESGLLPVDSSRVGPYEIVGAHWGGEHESLLAGRDPTLDRDVIVHRFVGGTRLPSETPGALQWLQGGEGWNAYERPGGASLWDWVGSRGRLTYAEAQDVLAGVVRGLVSTAPPTLSLTRLWVDAAGRTRLLDFDAVQPSRGKHPGVFPPGSWCAFLRQVLSFTLEGLVGPATGGESRAIAAPVPEHARPLLGRIAAGACGDSPAAVLADIEQRAERPLSLATARRGTALAVPTFGMIFATFSVATALLGTPFLAAGVELGRALATWRDARAGVAPEPEVVAAAETWLAFELARAERLAETAPRSLNARSELEKGLPAPGTDERDALEELRGRHHPPPGAGEAGDARARLGVSSQDLERQISGAVIGLFAVFLLGAGLASALALRGGVGLRIAGIAVQRRDGAPASRLRCLWRAVVAWAPVVAIVGLAWGTIAQGALSTAALVAGGAACVLLSASGAAYALSHPHRGLQDRLAGTVLMPT